MAGKKSERIGPASAGRSAAGIGSLTAAGPVARQQRH
jgi:hypothetical protein